MLVGLPTAWWLSRRSSRLRQLVGAAVMTPLVLPPTVLGYYLLLLISRHGPVGRVFDAAGVELAFTWRAAVLAAALGSFPLLVRAAQAGFESVDRQLQDAARTLGRYEWSVFSGITLPLAWRSVAAGTGLAFCRAFGDFGITLMVAGNIPGRTQTLPIAIYDHVQANAMREANTLAVVAVVVALAGLLVASRFARLRY
ncbi:MAG: molybdate ABC transporter permease subunit [Candidatus Rokubacteria bacterium]|nr:molybdate ABC transporter permease subunit [Candidatus Rokubacteria bacterium]